MNATVMQYRIRRIMPGVMALLLVVAGEAAAQAYQPASLERFEQAPSYVLAYSPSAVRALGHDLDLQALDAFQERRAEGFGSSERWRLYGRFGLLNFQNELDQNGGGVQVSWRRTGPALGTKIYVGIHRRF